MTLITSISGIRGTIGGVAGTGLTPPDIVRFTAAYSEWLRRSRGRKRCSIVLGRDARISGPVVENLVTGTLRGMGVDVINLGLTTTPTVELAVVLEGADGGIILTASHNPAEWNALKLLNSSGEFLSASDGAEILRLAENPEIQFSGYSELGELILLQGYNERHIQELLKLRFIDTDVISRAGFRVVVDCVNSTGGLIIPELLQKLGVKEVICINCTPDGRFPHNPEPLPENLKELSRKIVETQADLGFAVDPDVDRLAIVCEDGTMFGEEYTLVAVADYILSKNPGNTASNLSSTRALKDITSSYGQKYFASAVGEVNVVEVMKENNCVIGGEGNGGIIYPAFHYGRDALVGIAFFLMLLAERKISCSRLRKTYPEYVMSKNKIVLPDGMNPDALLSNIKKSYPANQVNDVDGVKIEFTEGWVHLRRSNTEPILRIYAEHRTPESASRLAEDVISKVKEYIVKAT
jgi:phosphomannomutase